MVHVQMTKVLRREDSQLTSHFDTDYWGQMLDSMRAQEQPHDSVAGAMASSTMPPNNGSPQLSNGGLRMLDPGAIASSAVRVLAGMMQFLRHQSSVAWLTSPQMQEQLPVCVLSGSSSSCSKFFSVALTSSWGLWPARKW